MKQLGINILQIAIYAVCFFLLTLAFELNFAAHVSLCLILGIFAGMLNAVYSELTKINSKK